MRSMTKTMAFAGALALVGSSAYAGVLVNDSHMPRALSNKNQLVEDCVQAIHNHWNSDAGLVLKHRARYGQTADGVRVVTVDGFVWQDGKRASVSHQCSDRQGPNRLALNVQFENQLASLEMDQ